MASDAQMAGVKIYNQAQKEAKRQRMRAFVDAIVNEYRQRKIEKGTWTIAEEMGISLATLNKWTSDPDWQEIAKEVKQARMMVLHEKLDRGIVNGEERQWLAMFLGVLNRIDPQTQEVKHSGSVGTFNIVSRIREPIPSEN